MSQYRSLYHIQIWLHFIIVNFITVKNMCISHNNPFTGKQKGPLGLSP